MQSKVELGSELNPDPHLECGQVCIVHVWEEVALPARNVRTCSFPICLPLKYTEYATWVFLAIMYSRLSTVLLVRKFSTHSTREFVEFFFSQTPQMGLERARRRCTHPTLPNPARWSRPRVSRAR